MLDENVADSVRKKLEKLGYECQLVKELIPEGSIDPLVAFVAEDRDAILISHDGDFKKISPRIPEGRRTRFRKLSRIQLQCKEFKAHDRIESAISLIEHEFKLAQNSHDTRMMLVIGESFIKTSR